MKKNIFASLILATGIFASCQNSTNDETSEENTYVPIENPDATAYITEVLDFSPAPGQFLNKVDNDLDTKENIVGDTYMFISLGTFGGSVTFKFDHSIMNKEGDDLAIYGNPFEGSSEPGIVMVCQDLNHNGVPDENEPWYQLKGSEFNKTETQHDVRVTYYKPEAEDDTHIIKYKKEYAGQVEEGELDFRPVIPWHPQPMFPSFYEEDEISFTGTLLASNVTEEDGVYYNNAYDWGYADNKGYEQEGILRSADLFDISNAVDKNGQSVDLIAVDFVKVYTATIDINGRIGERSTEVFKAADISLLPQEEN
ncbi:hypothetical protein KMW28_21730 [Flammeovirga yaeyamensis]|uniref:PKD domain-containing protein n=1 Tax=Flammeovirga yaeyamensis TaxID=367791 RepID=A0AAX1NEW3_9BACT|nr:PKD domain-containing protein [Flammeovirga yaeyamensis]MBB3697024.1 hypothetical protein [Flammeovirga yaeyamensis]NMF33687.1 PKD domain-containing protein [Flammeovirga yaeyamensis]QWG05047.1 hypothetical protein KMW28_21730 [Flammeovirga yaeyamensis]